MASEKRMQLTSVIINMNIEFYKYQGTGNDFIILNNKKKEYQLSEDMIRQICDRRFGIGADGLILLNEDETKALDFKMLYFVYNH